MHGSAPATWYGRLRQRWVDRAAQRMFERLQADPASFRSSPSTLAAVALALLIMAAALGYLAFLVWATLHAEGFVMWGLVALGWAVAIVGRPRIDRVPDEVTVLSREEYPGLHRVVDEMSTAVGVRPPAILGVDLDLNARVGTIGYPGRRRQAMVLGLPLMSLGSWDARLGVIGHELGHLRGRDTVRGGLLASAASTVDTMRYLLTPGDELTAEESWYPGNDLGYYDGAYESDAAMMRITSPVVRIILTVLAAPFHGVALLLQRLTLNDSQHREYLADRRSAQVVGSTAAVASMIEVDDGLLALAGSATRRGEDPFAALLARPPMSAAQRAARLQGLAAERIQADATHPPTHLRVRLVDEARLVPGQGRPDAATLATAEAELVRLRATHQRAFADLFRTGQY